MIFIHEVPHIKYESHHCKKQDSHWPNIWLGHLSRGISSIITPPLCIVFKIVMVCVLLNFYHTFIEAPHPKCCLMNFSAIKPHPRTPKSTPPLPLLHHPVAHFTKNISSWTKISFNSHPSVSKAIATKYWTCHDSTAVVACAKICSDVIPKNEIIAKLISYPPGFRVKIFSDMGHSSAS